jgi:hypothetical protein
MTELERALARLARIAEQHGKAVDEHGGTSGYCTECNWSWPCPTRAWAVSDRDPVLDAWDPADDNEVWA